MRAIIQATSIIVYDSFQEGNGITPYRNWTCQTHKSNIKLFFNVAFKNILYRIFFLFFADNPDFEWGYNFLVKSDLNIEHTEVFN